MPTKRYVLCWEDNDQNDPWETFNNISSVEDRVQELLDDEEIDHVEDVKVFEISKELNIERNGISIS